IRTYTDLQTLLNEVPVDIVCVCTASGRHLEPTLLAARAGKHILCEKPLEIRTDRVDQMIEACKTNKVLLGCIFQNRFSPDFIKLRNTVESGLLGKVVAINAMIPWYRNEAYYANSGWRGTLEGDGGGALINQGIHTVDLFQVIGGPVKQVFGKVQTTIHDIEGEDLATAIVTFTNGVTGLIQASTAMWPGYPERLEVFGEKGSIILEGGRISAFNIQGVETENQVVESELKSGSSDPMAISHEFHKRQIRDFAQSVLNNKKPDIDGTEGRKAVAIIEAIYESSKRNIPVVF
ncbi:MAG: Gfo/Idh/MocA family oxidoreductase, partial [Saprospiraceae bacterium]|nr:Gfo/Idh/MocA family oxidoreductase [Saprospiraceae bacterium]